MINLSIMLRLYADAFVRASSQIGQIYGQVQHGVAPAMSSWSVISGSLSELTVQCETMGLNATLAQIERVQNIVRAPPINISMFTSALMEINSRLNDELAARYLYCLDSNRVAYIQSNQFAPIVSERFPDAIPDMDEAAKCYAFERPTASIFHLMKVTEYALNEIAALLEIPDHNPTWEPIIRKIDAELKADYKDRKYKGNQDLLANVSTHLHAVKVAWRNKTMHVERINTMEHAKEIYDATCGLMRYLAENLPNRKPGIVQVIRGKLGV